MLHLKVSSKFIYEKERSAVSKKSEDNGDGGREGGRKGGGRKGW